MGGLIGFEREHRSSPAGFRTHILVSLSSALLMLAAVHQVRWLSDTPVDIIRIDPVRMAHGVLTGIGFLCGGVIFREGFTVRGLTTAASLWTTSALGVLFGVGFTGLAVIGGVATLIVLGAVGLTESLIPQRRYADIRIRFRRDAPVDAGEFRRLLKDHELSAEGVTQTLDAEGVEFSTTVSPYTETRAESLAATVRLAPSVVSFTCEPRRA